MGWQREHCITPLNFFDLIKEKIWLLFYVKYQDAIEK